MDTEQIITWIIKFILINNMIIISSMILKYLMISRDVKDLEKKIKELKNDK
ncbi:hypothetical protein [Vibrio aestuarianus]|uniref:hypothetical protein n=1 Tax=Vibrio aestuarianus TaxID=28171 RepID=UPI001455E1BA|nr:hypothetical protein [Vibrio aestuarianus]MDE1227206.1 hypothetical protein [Vibrio aestuarianus]MDE1255294.1 hypothetical protein [Vibrio aestuarianus]MDE1270102.1 hypothetical protein [Vibrio aestuarianus]MDE1307750.1 hypothetical protein [Vibrio aestuarianus]MDH5893517.1 hypothetical protein [Vibrio aestuarianus]